MYENTKKYNCDQLFYDLCRLIVLQYGLSFVSVLKTLKCNVNSPFACNKTGISSNRLTRFKLRVSSIVYPLNRGTWKWDVSLYRCPNTLKSYFFLRCYKVSCQSLLIH